MEMFHGFVYSQQFAVVCAIFLLSRIKFLGKESKGLPGVVDALL
jgi:hypothetical protein